MNIACIPYHDWRKIEMEGARTRDSHIISHLTQNSAIENVIVINRPITLTELLLKKKNKKIAGERIFKHKNISLYKITNNLYVIDYFSSDIFGPIIKNKQWFFDIFSDYKVKEAVEICLEFLNINVDIIYNQNIFASGLVKNLGKPCVFDAWDNFILFPENARFHDSFAAAYQNLSKNAEIWTTNADKNIEYYQRQYSPKKCMLVKNGVDLDKFRIKYAVPQDLANLKKPIIGFGGKITHLFNEEFFNYASEVHSDKTFVIVGQILDKNVFSKIKFPTNVHYLGDKHYSEYPSYVTNFDIGIIPYVTNHLEHGADSIKMYEYIASGIPVIGTEGAGMSDMGAFIKIATNKEEFSNYLELTSEKKLQVEFPDFYTWKYKSEQTLGCFQMLISDNYKK